MKLSLSVRISESFHNKTESSLTIDELVKTASTLGYEALCMRASQAGVHSPPKRVAEVARKIRDTGLSVSMLTGDFAVPGNGPDGPIGLRDITPYLDLADSFDTRLIRVCMKKSDDIEHARRASDEARERGVRLAHQSHFGSLFETVAGSRDTIAAIGRDNFGLIYEPANWMICNEDYVAGIHELRESIFNVYVQNHLIREGGTDAVETWKRGRVELDHIGIWDEGGVDADAVFAALREIGYDGYVTAHQAFEGVLSPVDAARKTFDYLRAVTS